MRLTLLEFDCDILATQDEKYQMTIAASEGMIRFDQIKMWINEKLVSIHP